MELYSARTEQISNQGNTFQDSQTQYFSEMSPNPNVVKGSKRPVMQTSL